MSCLNLPSLRPIDGVSESDADILAVKVSLMSNSGPPGNATPLSIGDVAALTGKRPSSIRYYEEVGVLPEPSRISGRRVYDSSTVRTLAVIETAQRAGLTLDEIRALLSASPNDAEAAQRLREVAERKLPVIAALIERSVLVRTWLECAARCECPNLDDCPLFDDASPPPL
jgi:MerR family redox-sensitive transcriptional activator SoxR